MKWERVIWALVVGALITLLLLKQCRSTKPCPVVSTKIDTVYRRIVDTIPGKPQIVVVKKFITAPAPDNGTGSFTSADYADPCDDTTVYFDSRIISTGNINIIDTIAGNRIAGRSVVAELHTPVITNTVTYTVEKQVPERKAQLYYGITAAGNYHTGQFGLGPALMLKTKTDNAFSIGAIYTNSGWLYQFGFHKKLSLKFNKK